MKSLHFIQMCRMKPSFTIAMYKMPQGFPAYFSLNVLIKNWFLISDWCVHVKICLCILFFVQSLLPEKCELLSSWHGTAFVSSMQRHLEKIHIFIQLSSLILNAIGKGCLYLVLNCSRNATVVDIDIVICQMIWILFCANNSLL